MIKILDCTLRDGGYYTTWDFKSSVIESYIRSIDQLPIDYIEVGYRNNPSSMYLGEYGYCPVYRLTYIKERTLKKIAIMLNERDVHLDDLEHLLLPIKGIVDMIRMAIDPKNISRAIELAASIKDLGFEVSFNVMYMSKWDEINIYSNNLCKINKIADVFCMVDSFGSILPNQVASILKRIKEYINIPIGFHAHNNLELALANTIVAIEQDIDFIDSTILGMGRGAGNLKTELLLTYLNKEEKLNVDFNILGDVVEAFNPLLDKCKWGTNLPYMISGANSFPQKEVMEWVNNRTYSFNNIVRALNNKKEKKESNKDYPKLPIHTYKSVLIIGGGESVINHLDGIKCFLSKQENCAIIHATSRNSLLYQEINIPQYFCLVGNESQRMGKIFKNKKNIIGDCILLPYPRPMDTDVPLFMEGHIYESSEISFTDVYTDSCTALALHTALSFHPTEIFIAGYDGYPHGLSEKEVDLSKENEILIQKFNQNSNIPLISITQTLYAELTVQSLYQSL